MIQDGIAQLMDLVPTGILEEQLKSQYQGMTLFNYLKSKAEEVKSIVIGDCAWLLSEDPLQLINMLPKPYYAGAGTNPAGGLTECLNAQAIGNAVEAMKTELLEAFQITGITKTFNDLVE